MPKILFDWEQRYNLGVYPEFTFVDEVTYNRNIFKHKLKSNLLIKVKSRHDIIKSDVPQEVTAQNTLRDMLTEKDWRGYATNGFIMVRGKTGFWYQIFRNQNPIRIYRNGKLHHTICIHTDRSCPATDHVINMKIMIEVDEDLLWKSGNIGNVA